MKKVIVIFLIVWILISSVRTLFNISKVYTEEVPWMRISDDQKREKLFGAIYPFLKKVEKETDRKSVILLYSGAKEFYLARYFLYPRRVIQMKSGEELLKSKGDYRAVFINGKGVIQHE